MNQQSVSNIFIMAKSTSPPNDVLGTLNAISANSFDAESDRIKALLAAYALVSRLETPWERIARMCMGEASPGQSSDIDNNEKTN